MNPPIIDGLITLALGVWFSLVAYGVIPLTKDKQKADEFRRKCGGLAKVLGPLVALFGIYNVLRGI